MNVLGRFVVVAAFGSLCWIACGGDSEGGDDGVALCKDMCAKFNACFADAGGGGHGLQSADVRRAMAAGEA